MGVCFEVGEAPGARVGDLCPWSHRYPSPIGTHLPPPPNSLPLIFTWPPGHHGLLVVLLPPQRLFFGLSVLALPHLPNLELEPLESPRPQSLDLFSIYIHTRNDFIQL